MYDEGAVHVVGMLLDLTASMLVLDLNGERKGLVGCGIVGPAQWAVDMGTPDAEDEDYEYMVVGPDSSSVRVQTQPVPAPPSEEVLAAEAAWLAQNHTD